jgi:hypothetical protein
MKRGERDYSISPMSEKVAEMTPVSQSNLARLLAIKGRDPYFGFL